MAPPACPRLVLRAMKPARYSEENRGHAGLGSPAYAHFTSPIRRYPDLIAHRALLSTVDGSEEAPSASEVAAAALLCSDSERDSMRVERDGDDICEGFLLRDELFKRGAETVFEGEVSGVIRSGAFIRFKGELSDVYEGFFPARRMKGDRFELNDVETALIGERTNRRVGIGDAIEVKVESVEAPRGRVDLIGPEAPAPKQKGSTTGRRRSSGGQRQRARRREGAPMSDDAAKAAKAAKRGPDVATNREARYSYEIVETFEVGVMLRGTEVKSLRDGKARLQDSYAAIEEGEVMLRAPTSRPTRRRARTTSRSGRASCSCTSGRSSG